MACAGTLRHSFPVKSSQLLTPIYCLTKKVDIRTSLNTGGLSPAFASTKVQIDYSADLVEELKAKIIKELETILLIISAHNLLEGAATFSIVSVADLDLNIPFDALYA